MRVKILFVCHGNICRSPMAAMVFRYLAQQRHVSGEFEVDSAALSSEEIGNGIYPPARRILVKHGVPCTEHRARQITPEDFETADLIIGMEWGHLKKLRALCPKEQQAKLHLLLDFAERQGDIEDPWYTDDFDRAYRDILRGCEGLLRNLTETRRHNKRMSRSEIILTSFLISAIILPFSALPPARFPSHPSGEPCAAPNLRSPA